MFQSHAGQDQFVANMLGFKRDGYFLDIGSATPVISNNTYFFESLNWSGICIEIDGKDNFLYKQRKCFYVNENALNLDYKKLFNEVGSPKEIDYLSVDIDTLSCELLTRLPFLDYLFKIITIEHDAYLYGDLYKSKQKKILEGNDYFLLCENVFIEQHGYAQNSPFEDWWVHPKFFNYDFLNKIKSNNLSPSNIIEKFRLL